MKTLFALRLAVSIFLVVLATLVIFIGVRISPSLSSNSIYASNPSQFYKLITRRSMKKHHLFIPANHKFMHFVGRWTSTANQLRRDAAFPGSYLEIAITNTTSIYCDLNNIIVDEEDTDSSILQERDVHHTVLQPADGLQPPSGPVSLLVQINDETVNGFEHATGLLLIADNLDPNRTYKLKITHLGTTNPNHGTIEIEGIWVSRPTLSNTSKGAGATEIESVLLNPLLWDKGGSLLKFKESVLNDLESDTIEIVTSETAFSAFFEDEPEETMAGRLCSWTDHFRKNHSLNTVILPTSVSGFLQHDGSAVTINDLFFRSGPVNTPQFSRPWSFKSYRPSALILQLGLVDFMNFFADKNNHNSRTIERFKNEFIIFCVKFIHNIRATAYRYDSSIEQPLILRETDGSYSYNSAPSTIPIFLITPFTASRRFVTKKQKLHTVISDVLSQVASTLQSEGDKSTFWIDTSGWLDPQTDFMPRFNFSSVRTRLDTAMLTPFANYKVASLLADHLCPYLKAQVADISAIEQCQFNRYDNYLGDVYLPKDVDFNRAMLERKIAMIKEKFSVEAE